LGLLQLTGMGLESNSGANALKYGFLFAGA
jgi:hypothetical protein